MKKIIIAIIACAIFATSAFAKSGFEFGLTFPMGLSIGIPHDTLKDELSLAEKKTLSLEPAAFFEWGATMQVGYKYDLGNDMGLSLLLDAGYRRDVIAFHQTKVRDGVDTVVGSSYVFDTIQIGVLPKLSIHNIAIGLGGGVKVPVSNYALITEGTVGSDHDDLDSTLIPYVKLTFDYALPVDTKTYIVFGAYAGYDFPLNEKLNTSSRYTDLSFSAVDVGAQIGLKYSL